MANSVSGSVSLNLTLGTSSASSSGRRLAGSISADVSGSNFIRGTQSIPTSATAIGLGALGSLGAYAISNLDATHYVDILSSTTGTTFAHILPGNTHVGYFPSTVTAPAAKANTAAVIIDYLISEP